MLPSTHFGGRGTNMTFAEDFAKNHGQPLMVNGQEVVPMVRRAVRPGARIRVIWRSARSLPVQGIRIKVQDGKLSVAGAHLNDVVLWRDTAPDETVLDCHVKKPTEVRIWNCWRDDRGVTQAWVGNAAMRVVESGPDSISVACNASQEVTFSDLVFDVMFEAS
jgi:hypothetical protein